MTVAWPKAGPAAQESSTAELSQLARDDSDASMDFYDQLPSLDEDPRHAAVTIGDQLGSGDLQALIAGGGQAAEGGPLMDDELLQWIDEQPVNAELLPQQAPAAGGAAAMAVAELDPVLLRWCSDDYQVDALPADFQPLLSESLTGARDSAPPQQVRMPYALPSAAPPGMPLRPVCALPILLDEVAAAAARAGHAYVICTV